jgi:hypothetical protein
VGAPLRLPRCNNFKLAKYLGEGTSRRSRGEILCFCFLGNDAAADHVVDGYPSACGPLFGGAHLTASASGVSAGETDFAWAAGGGLDAHLNSRYSVRLAQFDFLQTRFGGENQNNFRYSAGILIKF